MYRLIRISPFLLVPLCLLCMLAACGSNEQTAHTRLGNSTPTPSVHATVSPTVQSTPPRVPSTPVPTHSVVVTTSKTEYLASDAITVTVSNNLSASIYASGYYTNCTPAQLEMKSGTVWTTLGRCPEATQSALSLQPGSANVFLLQPSTGPMISHTGSGATWTSGTYRVSFNYTLQPDPDTSQGGINIVSKEFTIHT